MASFGVAVLLLLSCSVLAQAQQNNNYQQAYGQYFYYSQNDVVSTIYRFCIYNLYNCRAITYTNFCVTYDTTCDYPFASVGGYYSLLLTRYCSSWCDRCKATYSSSCRPTTTTPAAPPPPKFKCEYGNYTGIEPRLFNANAASQCKNPWVVALHALQPTAGTQLPPLCQGVLLDERTVATTLECKNNLARGLVSPGSTFYVRIGEYVWSATEPGEKTISANVSSIDYRTGVVKLLLNQPLSKSSFSKCVSPACLPTSDRTIDYDRTNCKVTGWGLTSSTTFPFQDSALKTGKVVISDDIECDNILTVLNSTPGGVNLTLANDHAIGCTLPTESQSSACLGDEGGAITCKERTTDEDILVGLVRVGKCDTLKVTFFGNVTTL